MLIVVARAHGHTATFAQALAARLRARGHEVEIGDALVGQLPPPADYDAVLLGTDAAFDADRRTIGAYIAANREGLAEIPTALFVVCRPDAAVDPRRVLMKLEVETGWRPLVAGTVVCGRAGRLRDVARRSLLALLRKIDDTLDPMHGAQLEITNLADSIHRELARANIPDVRWTPY